MAAQDGRDGVHSYLARGGWFDVGVLLLVLAATFTWGVAVGERRSEEKTTLEDRITRLEKHLECGR
jgi:hypothetical protein